MQQPDDISDKEFLSAKERNQIADDLSISTGVFGALCVAALVSLGLLLLHGSAILPTAEHPLIARANDAPPSPRAVVAQRFYFDSKAAGQM
jgi:hypothetical protein